MEYGSEFDWESNTPFLRDNNEISNIPVDFYRSGRDALKAVAYKYKEKYNTVLLPALCCDSMLAPFTEYGYNISFYKLKNDFSVDESDLKLKIKENSIILFIRYFGMKAIPPEYITKSLKNNPNVLFLEDRTHDIIVPRNEDKQPNVITVASIRKWAALPEGGLVYNISGTSEFPDEHNFFQIRKKAMQKKSSYLKNPSPRLKEEFLSDLRQSNLLLEKLAPPYSMSEAAKALLNKIDFCKIYQIRKNNVSVLQKELQTLVSQNKISFVTQHPENSTLYFPIFVNNRDLVQEKLAKKDLYCPVIWPIPEQAVGICNISEYAAKHILALPCDQRYTTEDMKNICNILTSVL